MLAREISDASSLLGLLLALVTLFTTETSRRIEGEEAREGGPRADVKKSIVRHCVGLFVVTVSSVAALGPLVVDVLQTMGGQRIEPTYVVFILVVLLLGSLAFWQAVLAHRARRL